MFQDKPNRARETLAVLMLTVAAISASGCMTSSAEDNDIKVRQDSMKSWSDAKDMMGGMIENPQTFDKSAFKHQALFLAVDSQKVWQHFKEKDVASSSDESIWSDPEGWEFETHEFSKAAMNLSNIAQGAQTAQAVAMAYDDVSASCKSCHTSFKVKKSDN